MKDGAAMIAKLSVVTLMNKEEQYAQMARSLRRQAPEGMIQFLPIHADNAGWNAATALNHGIEEASADWIVCVHQDVIFPDSWLARFSDALAALPDDTAVVGLVGYTISGRYVGHIVDPHGHTRWGRMPRRAMSIDEHLIALKKSSGLRFDPGNPGFLFYGTDICLSAIARGFQALVIDAPVVHLSGGRTDTKFDFAASWLLKKWGADYHGILPTTTMLVGRPRLGNWLKWAIVKMDMRDKMLSKRYRCDCGAVSCSPF